VNCRTLANLRRAERKLRPFGTLYCGYLADGGREDGGMYGEEVLRRFKKAGDSGPRWFYFYPTRAQKERLAALT
jgi:hypothetical protein